MLESETHVDMDKLLSLCQHGLPAVLRGEAWMYLLGVSPPEKSEEMSLGKRMGQEFVELEKALLPQSSELARCIKGEVKRRVTQAPDEASRDAKTRQRLERLLRCYMHGHGNEFHAGMVHLLSPLVHVYATDVEAYFCFQELMRQLERALTFEGCKQMAVTFMTLLRHGRSWQRGPDDLCWNGAPCALPVASRAQAAPTRPGAPPRLLGCSPQPPEPASAGSQDEVARTCSPQKAHAARPVLLL